MEKIKEKYNNFNLPDSVLVSIQSVYNNYAEAGIDISLDDIVYISNRDKDTIISEITETLKNYNMPIPCISEYIEVHDNNWQEICVLFSDTDGKLFIIPSDIDINGIINN